MEHLKYPIGRNTEPTEYTNKYILNCIHELEIFPENLKKVWSQISKEKQHSSYRENGWNAIQLVHHLADSHMNAYIRTMLTLKEEHPTIKPYDENTWAESKFQSDVSIDDTIILLSLLHKRWTTLLRSLNFDLFDRTHYHPENKEIVTLKKQINYYAWHGKQHIAHLNIIAKK